MCTVNRKWVPAPKSLFCEPGSRHSAFQQDHRTVTVGPAVAAASQLASSPAHRRGAAAADPGMRPSVQGDRGCGAEAPARSLCCQMGPCPHPFPAVPEVADVAAQLEEHSTAVSAAKSGAALLPPKWCRGDRAGWGRCWSLGSAGAGLGVLLLLAGELRWGWA